MSYDFYLYNGIFIRNGYYILSICVFNSRRHIWWYTKRLLYPFGRKIKLQGWLDFTKIRHADEWFGPNNPLFQLSHTSAIKWPFVSSAGRAMRIARSTEHSAYSYLIHLVRQGVVTDVDRRGSPRLNARYYTAFPGDFGLLSAHHRR